MMQWNAYGSRLQLHDHLGSSFVVADLLSAVLVALAVDLGSAILGSLDGKINWVADDVSRENNSETSLRGATSTISRLDIVSLHFLSLFEGF